MPRRRPTASRHQEGGYTLIELLVSLIIAAILLSVMVGLYNSQREKARMRATQAAAASYAQAVEAFRLENANYVPRYNSPEWPGPGGPMSTLSQKPFATGGAPEIVTSPLATHGARITNAAPATGYKGGTIAYITSGGARPFQYSLGAYWDGKLICAYGNAPSGPHRTKSC